MRANDPDPYAAAERGALDEVYPYRAKLALLDHLAPEQRVSRADELMRHSSVQHKQGNTPERMPFLTGPAGLGQGEAGAPPAPASPTPPTPMSTAIPAMASGGIVTKPTVALIGEAGPEAVVPLGGLVPEAAGMQPGTPTPTPTPTPEQIQAYITQAAAARGIDPAIALRVAMHEGLAKGNPAEEASFETGKSWWPFQLHYGGPGYEQWGDTAGLGNDFTAATGWRPGDPQAWQPSVDFALDAAVQRGWYPTFYGSQPAGRTAAARPAQEENLMAERPPYGQAGEPSVSGLGIGTTVDTTTPATQGGTVPPATRTASQAADGLGQVRPRLSDRAAQATG